MNINYNFKFQDGRDIEFKVTGESSSPPQGQSLPAWVRLEHCQCSNCPLKPGETPYCPAATEILPVVEAFQAEDAYQKVDPESVTSLANIPVKPTSAPTRGDNWVRF
jgi:hypothetical protein